MVTYPCQFLGAVPCTEKSTVNQWNESNPLPVNTPQDSLCHDVLQCFLLVTALGSFIKALPLYAKHLSLLE